jgi:hypothetical protein
MAVVAGAALGGAGGEEIATILLLGWLVVRILAGAIASEAVHRWLRRRRR